MTVFTVMLVMTSAVYVASPGMKQLVEDVRLALRRADIDEKEVALTIGCSKQRLSLQFGHQEPFTLWCRFVSLSEKFWAEFITLRAERHGIAVVPNRDLADLILRLDLLTKSNKAMARMTLAEPQQLKQEKTA